MKSAALLLLLAVPAFGASCDEGWKPFKGACYKQFNNKTDRVDFTAAEARCVAEGAHLTTVASHAELNFITNISRLAGTFHWRDLPLIGVFRNLNGEFENVGGEKAPFVRKWCQYEPNNLGGKENCVFVRFDAVVAGKYVYRAGPPCMYDIPCNGNFGGAVKGFSRYICKKIVPGLEEPKLKPLVLPLEPVAAEQVTEKAAAASEAAGTEKPAEVATEEPAKATTA